MDTTSNVKLDISLNKEDIFLVIQQEQAEKIEAQIETLRSDSNSLSKVLNNYFDKLRSLFAKSIKRPFNTEVFLNENIAVYKTVKQEVPKKDSSKSTKYIYLYECSLRESFSYQLSTKIEGIEFTSKSLITKIKPNKTIQNILHAINSLNQQLFDIEVKIDALEYELHQVLNSNKYKVKVIKKILKSSNINHLLTE